jgi:hypothetical protein
MKNKNVKQIEILESSYDLIKYWEFFCKNCKHNKNTINHKMSSICNLCKIRIVNPTHFLKIRK